MYHLAAADVQRYMADSAVAVEDQVSCLKAVQADRCSAAGLRCGCTRNSDSEIREYRLCKSGTIRSVGQAGSSPYIGISHELQRVIGNLLSQRRAG